MAKNGQFLLKYWIMSGISIQSKTNLIPWWGGISNLQMNRKITIMKVGIAMAKKVRSNWQKSSFMMKLLIKYNLRSITRKIGKRMINLISKMTMILPKIGKDTRSPVEWPRVLPKILCKNWENLVITPTPVLVLILTRTPTLATTRTEKNNSSNRNQIKIKQFNPHHRHFHQCTDGSWIKN